METGKTVSLEKAFVLCCVFSLFSGVCGYAIGWRIRQAKSTDAVQEQVRELSGTAEAPALHRYPVEKILRVVDGDTYDVRFAIWEDIVLVKRLRLLGVDTPELRPRKGTDEEKAAEKQAALAALAYVQQITDKAAALYVVTDWKSDSFGRVLAGVRYVDQSGTEKDLAAMLLESGHAKIYEK